MLPRCSTTSRGFHPRGELDGLERVALRQFAVPRPRSEENWYRLGAADVDPHGQRAEVVQAGDFDFAGIDRLEDARQEADPGAVAQLGVFESPVRGFRAASPGHRCADGNSNRWTGNT